MCTDELSLIDLTRKRVQMVALDSTLPALRPCRYCGHEHGYLTGTVGVHHDGVRCAQCERHIGWIPAPQSDDLTLIDDGDGA